MNYEMTDEKPFGSKTLRRIRAIRDFSPQDCINVHIGDLGGWIETEANLADNAWVYGNALVNSSEDYCVYKNTWSSFRWLTYTRSNKKWSVGCFYGTGEELIKKAYADSELSGRCYEAIVRAQEAIDSAVAAAGEREVAK